MMWTAGGRRRALGRSFEHAERLTPSEAREVAEAYVKSPAYPEASALMMSGKVEDIGAITAPITLAWAEHDRLVRNRPLPGRVVPERVRQVELLGCGHVPTWDDPDLVAQVILDGTSRAG
jgi:pimeloyl-ACP methyl ester carboxylesterase